MQSPADLQRRNPNLVQGDVGTGSYTLDQAIFRPLPSLAPYRTPIRGLFLGSAATFPGGAAHGVPGRAAAGAALLQARVRRRYVRLPGGEIGVAGLEGVVGWRSRCQAGPAMKRSVAPAGGASALRFFMSLRGYERAWLRGDVIAGLTVCAILVPQALAYASIAGCRRWSVSTRPRARCCSTPRWELTGARRRPDGGQRRPVGGHGGRPRPARRWRFAAFTAALALAAGLAALIAGLLRLGSSRTSSAHPCSRA